MTGPPDRNARAQVNGVGKGLAINRVRDRLAELLGENPVAARILRPVRRPQVEEQQIRIGADAEFEDANLVLIDERPQRGDVLGTNLLLQHVDLPGLQSQQFRVLIWHHLEHYLIGVRQLNARGVLLPIARVAIEHEALARIVAAKHVGTKQRQIGGRGGHGEGLRERPAFISGLQLVLGQQVQVVENSDPRPEGGRHRHHHRLRVRRRHL